MEEEDNDINDSFLGVSIVSTITIEKTHFDMNGLYQCIGMHKELYSEQTFQIDVISNGKILLFHIIIFYLFYRNKFNRNKFF